MTLATAQARLAVRSGLLKAARSRLADAEAGLAWATAHKRASAKEREGQVATLRLLVARRTLQVVTARKDVARLSQGVTTPSLDVARIIAGFEGGQSNDGLFHPYWDANGNVWTIGYGHTEGVGPRSRPLTKSQAVALLRDDLEKKYAPAVARACQALGLKLRQHEFDALVSLVYNCGPGVLDAGRSMGDALRAGRLVRRRRVAAAFGVYVKDAHGQTLAGLVTRRKAERALWLG